MVVCKLYICKENNMLPKAILMLDNVPDFPTHLQKYVLYMPSNSTSLLNPMDPSDIITFKAYYQHESFR